MRIIGGRWRGHLLAAVPRKGVRPTADPLREALFNILADRIVGRPFLDLCAGTGAVGFEALSRGAYPVVLVEHHRQALRTISKNLARLGIEPAEGSVEVVAAELGRWLRSSAADLLEDPAVIFVDPPYGERRLGSWLALIEERRLLGEDSLLIVEHRSSQPPELGRLEHLWTRRYGDASLTAAARS